jgi:hypothetical protein
MYYFAHDYLLLAGQFNYISGLGNVACIVAPGVPFIVDHRGQLRGVELLAERLHGSAGYAIDDQLDVFVTGPANHAGTDQ